MIDHPFFQEALPILRKLEKAGYEAVFVGGAVRDFLLQRPVTDVDIATSAEPFEVKQIFTHTVDLGIEHGTVLVLLGGRGFEVTTFRTESGYSDFRRPDSVKFVRSLYEDLKRRDFTINAMAMTEDGKLIDPFNGKEDLKKKIIRTVGSATERFSEDALRMMRAARFISQLSFELDLETKKAMQELAELLSYIAVERKLNEIDKLFAGTEKKKALAMLIETGLFTYLPGFYAQKQVLQEIIAFPINSLSEDQMWLLTAFMFEPDQVKEFLGKWRMSQKRIKRIAKGVHALKRFQKEGWHEVLLYEAGLDVAKDSAKVASVLNETTFSVDEVAERWHSLPIKSRQELDVTGTDLIKWAEKPRGAWIKECLEQAEKAVLTQKVANRKSEIERWVRACNLL